MWVGGVVGLCKAGGGPQPQAITAQNSSASSWFALRACASQGPKALVAHLDAASLGLLDELGSGEPVFLQSYDSSICLRDEVLGRCPASGVGSNNNNCQSVMEVEVAEAYVAYQSCRHCRGLA